METSDPRMSGRLEVSAVFDHPLDLLTDLSLSVSLSLFVFWSPGPGSDVELHPHHHHYSDGSVESDLPMKQLSELFNVNHFIVSQVCLTPHSPTGLLLISSTGQRTLCHLLHGDDGAQCLAPASLWGLCRLIEVSENTSEILGELCH
jgi:hypothetical protein